MIIYMLGNNAICPSCSGTLIVPPGCIGSMQCINCHSVFEIVGLGRADREYEVKKVEPGVASCQR